MMELLTFLVTWGIRSALVVAIALLASLALYKASSATKNIVWRGALVATFVLGVGMLIAPRVGFQASIESPIAETILAPRIAGMPIAPAVPIQTYGRRVYSQPTPAPEESDLPTIFFGIYVIGVVAIFARWASSLVHVRRLCLSGHITNSKPEIIHVDEKIVPCTFGWLSPCIVLPNEAQRWSRERWSAVILHESAHVNRKDWLWQTLAMLGCAVQWFNPAAWILSSALRSTAEESADNEVLTSGIAPSAYAKELVSFATDTASWPMAATGVIRRGRMAKRITRVLAVGQNRGAVNRKLVVTASAVFAMGGLGLASYAPLVPKALEAIAQAQPKPKPSNYPSAFQDGTIPKFLFVGDGRNSGFPTWEASGKRHKESMAVKMGMGYTGGAVQGSNRVVVAVQISTHMPDSTFIYAKANPYPVRLGGVIDDGGGRTGRGDANPSMTLHNTFGVPDSWKTADYELGRGIGEFKPVGSFGPDKHDFYVKLLPGQHESSSKMVDGKEVKSEYTTTMIHFQLPKEAEDRDWRLSAFDKDGKQINLLGFYPRAFPFEGVLAYQAQTNGSSAAVERLVFEARDYEWVAIKGLHLYPKK